MRTTSTTLNKLKAGLFRIIGPPRGYKEGSPRPNVTPGGRAPTTPLTSTNTIPTRFLSAEGEIDAAHINGWANSPNTYTAPIQMHQDSRQETVNQIETIMNNMSPESTVLVVDSDTLVGASGHVPNLGGSGILIGASGSRPSPELMEEFSRLQVGTRYAMEPQIGRAIVEPQKIALQPAGNGLARVKRSVEI